MPSIRNYLQNFIETMLKFTIFLILTINSMDFVVNFTTEDLSNDLRFIKICNRTSPVSLRTMNEVLINKQLDHHNNHHEVYSFKCFLHCLFTKYGWMDELGGFLLHDIKQTLEESDIEVKSLEFILYKCTAIDSMNRCERAYKFTKCFWEIISEQQPSDDQLFYNVDEQNDGLIFK